MLYVTTRSDRDAYTANHVMLSERAPDGGQFVPMAPPYLGQSALKAAAERSFHENVASMLNQFWDSDLTGWDIDLHIGKLPVNFRDLNSRTMVAEIWHNPDLSFPEISRKLFHLVAPGSVEEPGQWFEMTLRIAHIFGIFAILAARGLVSGEKPLDVAVPSFDFQYPMALWYARSWGLPIGRIICACNENNAPWGLLHQGEIRTDMNLRRTYTAACDQAVPAGLERLIYATLGQEEVQRFARTLERRRMYTLTAAQQLAMRAGISVCVVSQRRMEFMIPNLFQPDRWCPDPYTAMAYTALVDHRSHSGETGKALLISEEDPIFSAEMLSKAMGVSADTLRDFLRDREGGI